MKTKKEKQKMMLLVLPLLLVPLTGLFIFLLSADVTASGQPAKSGLNALLPAAQIKDDTTSNKLSFYQQARLDSQKVKQDRQQDPYYSQMDAIRNGDPAGQMDPGTVAVPGAALTTGSGRLDAREQQIAARLNALNAQIASAQAPAGLSGTLGADPDQDKMAALMKQLDGGTGGNDPEMQQLNGMLEKLMALQNPELANQKARENSEKHRGRVYPVTAATSTTEAGVLEAGLSDWSAGRTGFYSSGGSTAGDEANVIGAIVPQKQTLVDGAILKMKLVTPVLINGKLIPKGSYISGTVALGGERLMVTVRSVSNGSSIYQVNLSASDLDGMPGLYIPGTITRDVAKQSSNDALQSVGFNSLDGSFGAQAASAGIELTKSLVGKKIKLIKVTVKAGYRLFLRDDKNEENN